MSAIAFILNKTSAVVMNFKERDYNNYSSTILYILVTLITKQ